MTDKSQFNQLNSCALKQTNSNTQTQGNNQERKEMKQHKLILCLTIFNLMDITKISAQQAK